MRERGLAAVTSGSASCHRSGACEPAPSRQLQVTPGLRSSAPEARRRCGRRRPQTDHLRGHRRRPVSQRPELFPDGAAHRANPVVEVRRSTRARQMSNLRRATDRRMQAGPGQHRPSATHWARPRRRMAQTRQWVCWPPPRRECRFRSGPCWRVSLLRRAAQVVLSATGTVRAVRWVPSARDVRIRRSAVPGRCAAPGRAFRLVREPTRRCCSRNRSWVMSPSKLVTGLAILRAATPSRGMTIEFSTASDINAFGACEPTAPIRTSRNRRSTQSLRTR